MQTAEAWPEHSIALWFASEQTAALYAQREEEKSCRLGLIACNLRQHDELIHEKTIEPCNSVFQISGTDRVATAFFGESERRAPAASAMFLYLLSQFRRKTVQRHEVGESGFLMAKNAWNLCEPDSPAPGECASNDRLYSLSCVQESDCHLGDGETWAGTTTSILGSPFSPVRFLWELSRNPGITRESNSKRRQSFSAVQTAWRRGRHSNRRYRSEWPKSRRLRKLRGINWFRNSPADCLLSIPHAKQSGFAEVLVAKGWRWCG